MAVPLGTHPAVPTYLYASPIGDRGACRGLMDSMPLTPLNAAALTDARCSREEPVDGGLSSSAVAG